MWERRCGGGGDAGFAKLDNRFSPFRAPPTEISIKSIKPEQPHHDKYA